MTREKAKSFTYALAQPWLLIRCLVVLVALYLLFTQRTFWTPDTIFFILLIVFAAFGQVRPFIIRFAPLIVLLLVYESFRSIVPSLNSSVHFTEMIVADTWLTGGTLPTAWLQSVLWNGTLQWYDFYFYFLYTIHFVMPIALGVLIWKRFGDALYWQFMLALLLLSYAAFLTYLLFPAAPPWLAAEQGYIAPITRISSDIWQAMGIKDVSAFYANLSPNPVAAVPSLHSAYPALFVLFINRMYGVRRTWWAWAYPASVWLGVVYLGEHYIIDVALGLLYAVFAYMAADVFMARQKAKKWPLKRWWQKNVVKPVATKRKQLKLPR